MTLSTLLARAGLPAIAGSNNDAEINAVTADSRRVAPGTVFVAIRGSAGDGHHHVTDALRRGAAAVVVETLGDGRAAESVLVPDTRVALDRLAAAFFSEPARDLRLVGITGTNGKTTVAYMIEAVLNRAGCLTGVMGTIDHHLGSRTWPTALTTPDPVTLHGRLREFNDAGARAAAFEISSHALVQMRADSLPLDVGVFTNLTRDHLDYHGDLESYFRAKELLFTRLLGRRPGGTAVLNGDDPRVRQTRTADGVRRWYFGEGDFDFGITIVDETLAGTRFELKCARGTVLVNLPCPGRHNVYNAAAALASGCALDLPLAAGVGALEEFRGAPGRMESVANARGLFIFVDYAHTDDALRAVCASLARLRDHRHRGARVIVVFGCGGDRDRGKRPLMARAAVDHADVVIVTSDNPRTEDPEAIMDQVCAGIPVDWPGEVHREVDRRLALRRALQCAVEGDVILVAGKGHESDQIIGETKYPFSDRGVLAELLKD